MSTSKIFKKFCACKLVLASNHQHPENIQRLFRLKNCLSCESPISRKYSKTFWPASCIPAATSNHPASSIPAATSNQQQQPTAAINSSNQQQQPATEINGSDQQQQAATAINSSNQQQQAATEINGSDQQQQAAATSIRPTSSTYTINAGIC